MLALLVTIIPAEFIEKLRGFKDKFQDKLTDQAIDYILETALDYGVKAIPILIELMKA